MFSYISSFIIIFTSNLLFTNRFAFKIFSSNFGFISSTPKIVHKVKISILKMEIKCKFEMMQFLEDDKTLIYSCKVSSASIAFPSTDIKKFIGKHLPGKN